MPLVSRSDRTALQGLEVGSELAHGLFQDVVSNEESEGSS
jgi:hypothetical protein